MSVFDKIIYLLKDMLILVQWNFERSKNKEV